MCVFFSLIGDVSAGTLSLNETKNGHKLYLNYQAKKSRTLIYFLCAKDSAVSPYLKPYLDDIAFVVYDCHFGVYVIKYKPYTVH